ncbi:MAG: hypothetical protein D8M58_22000 [Calditrichaeota bacterium]|nr:MAG: hypothetical protein DWQ03_11115 [Calditrichota bacterium]MBL1208086.1 hypothetical protein [Calditrichota bacterium]NOG47924.1 hypothetical protein [Calditrichota bacterium]
MSEQVNGQSVNKLSPVSLLSKIFTDPQQAFENIKVHPNWLIPIVLTLIYGFLFNYTTLQLQTEASRQLIMESTKLNEEMKDKALEGIETQTTFSTQIQPGISAVAGTFLAPLIIALVLMVFGNFIYGGSASFNVLFSASVWAGMIGLAEGIVKLPMMLSKGTLEIYTSLALVMDLSESKTFLFQLLNLVDVFSIWKVFVYSTAFIVIYKVSATKSYATIISLYLIYSFVLIGIMQLFM